MTKRPITVYRSGSLAIVIAACVLGPTSSLPSFNSPGFSCLSPVNNKPGLLNGEEVESFHKIARGSLRNLIKDAAGGESKRKDRELE